MNEEDASIAYWHARELLQEVIDSEQRGSKEEILEELKDDLT